MPVRLRLMRMGRKNRPFYRIHVCDSRSKRDGRVIEQLGWFDPVVADKEKQIELNLDRCRYWLDLGAQPSETVSTLLKRKGFEHRLLHLPRPGKPKAVPAVSKKD